MTFSYDTKFSVGDTVSVYVREEKKIVDASVESVSVMYTKLKKDNSDFYKVMYQVFMSSLGPFGAYGIIGDDEVVLDVVYCDPPFVSYEN